MYNTAFHKSIEEYEIEPAKRIANYVASYIKPTAFFDFGCSTGLYLREIKACLPAIPSHGFEFSSDAVSQALCADVHKTDLTHPFVSPISRTENTLGICLEVLEHIDDAYWHSVLTNLVSNCDILFFSAALPGQSGTGHINCRPRIDWIRRFHTLGWVVDVDATEHLLDYMRKGLHMGWFVQNVMIFVPADRTTPSYHYKFY